MSPANPNAFANSPLDRAGARRRDPDWLAAAWASPEARLAAFRDRKPLVRADGGALWLHPSAAASAYESPALFLGVDGQGRPHFAVEAGPGSDPAGSADADGGAFLDLRAAAALLPGPDLAMLGAAKAVFEWHARHGFCAACGAPSTVVDAGWKRVCPACQAQHFPRVDPVVIMLPIAGEACLLARPPRLPPGIYTALAGFVEPGESVEEACARETLEEVGLKVRAAAYHSSQPWPFPSTLMIGLLAEVEPGPVVLEAEELEDARWFTRAQARDLLKGDDGALRAPPPFTIAHQLLAAWTA